MDGFLNLSFLDTKRGLRLAVILLAAAGLSVVPGIASFAAPATTLEAQVDALVAGANGDTPGLVVLVARHREILLEKGYGLGDIESRAAITPDSRFRVGSITKQFTAAAILKLQEEGKLRLEQSLSAFIPDWPRGKDVTLYHLLTHTSGISDFTDTSAFATNATTPTALEDLIESFRDGGYDFEPGSQYRYSNSGYVLLAFVIEKASGLSYGDYLADAFFEPLGMKHTGNYRTGRPVPGQALGYACEDGTVRRAVEWDLSRLVGAGSLYSTAGDLHRWNEAVFNGEVLSPASLDAAFTVGFVDGDDARYPEETGYGMGWTIETLRGQRVIGHGGELPGFGGYLLRLPTRQLTVVVLVNCVPHLPGLQQWALARRIAEVSLGQELPPEPAPKVDTSVTVAALDAIVGDYDMGAGQVLSVTREGHRVFFEVTGRPRTEMFPRSERVFFVGTGEAEATFVSRESGEVVKAVLRQAGQRIDARRMRRSSATSK